MSQVYSDPEREDEPTALPDFEVFYVTAEEAARNADSLDSEEDGQMIEEGWYYWPCLPGCLPDGDAVGPFTSEQAAINDLRSF